MRLVRKVLGKGDYWTKYRKLYDQGKFDLKSKKRFLEDWFEDDMGYFPDIDHPRTFNEKIQWMKLYYDDPSIARCIDKVTFKDYIGEALGRDYVVPAIKVYGSAEEVDFRELPDRFV
ncbi:MAG: hypothetical protein MUE65_07310, partial [Methanomassiliicoccales archaeon]|nr:hypothetical protein [Methanomassiliicoccales archaeon]